MKPQRSWLTPRQAADLSGVTSRTINNYITSGKLSATREDGRYFIEKSEFFRVFPNCMAQKGKNITEKSQENSDGITSEIEIKYLKEALLDKEKQNDFLKELLERHNHEKSLMLQTIHSNTLILQHQKEKKTNRRWLERLKIWKKR